MDEMDYTESGEYKIAMGMWKYLSPSLIAIGIVGNILVLVVLSISPMKHTTTSLYLRSLAVFDCLVLCTGLLRQWIFYLLEYDIRNYSQAACKIHTWLTYSTTYISAWLLVSVSLERCGAVWFPHRVKAMCTKRTTYIIILSIILLMTVLTSHYLYGLGDRIVNIANETVVLECQGIYVNYFLFEKNIWPWMDFCVYSVLPSSILTFCNISIIYKVAISNRRIQNMNTLNGSVNQERSMLPRQSQAFSLTAMLVATSVTYVVCTTPFCIYTIYSNVFHYDEGMDFNGLMWASVNLLQYMNNCINFVLYCVSGRKFREELRALFLCKKPQTSNVYSLHMNNMHIVNSTTQTSLSNSNISVT